jgi:glutamyl-tRNA synthetase
VSNTSDHFRTCEDLARTMIRDGNAYMDNTDQETMQAERMQHIESKHRNNSVEENLKWFELLLQGECV